MSSPSAPRRTRRLSSLSSVRTEQRPSRGQLASALAVMLATVGCAPAGPRTPDAVTDALRHSLRVGPPLNIDLSYLRAGDAHGPRLILVHGTPGESTGWTDYLMHPPTGVEVVALDRPGFGDSGPPGPVISLAQQAAALAALLPTDGRPAVLLGHSLGGPIVAWLAAEQPERISAIVLLAGSLDPGQERIHPMQWVGNWPPVRALLPRAIRNANAELIGLKPELQALAGLLPRITAKIVIMQGTQDDLVPAANVPYMQPLFTGARCVRTLMLEGRNHFLPWNSQDDVREAIRLALEPTC